MANNIIVFEDSGNTFLIWKSMMKRSDFVQGVKYIPADVPLPTRQSKMS